MQQSLWHFNLSIALFLQLFCTIVLFLHFFWVFVFVALIYLYNIVIVLVTRKIHWVHLNEPQCLWHQNVCIYIYVCACVSSEFAFELVVVVAF